MCGYFCVGFIDFMLKGKSLLDYTNSFSPKEYKKNDTIIVQLLKRWKNYIAFFCSKYRKFRNSKISYILEKILILSIICCKCRNEDEKIFKEEESIEILRILGLFKNI